MIKLQSIEDLIERFPWLQSYSLMPYIYDDYAFIHIVDCEPVEWQAYCLEETSVDDTMTVWPKPLTNPHPTVQSLYKELPHAIRARLLSGAAALPEVAS
jgi:hypothetical protein